MYPVCGCPTPHCSAIPGLKCITQIACLDVSTARTHITSPVAFGLTTHPFQSAYRVLSVSEPHRYSPSKMRADVFHCAGATCSGGDHVLANHGYWSANSAELYFVACQLGYCCPGNDVCPWKAVCRSSYDPLPSFFRLFPLAIGGVLNSVLCVCVCTFVLCGGQW